MPVASSNLAYLGHGTGNTLELLGENIWSISVSGFSLFMATYSSISLF
jgi:hypothetical protein